MKFSVAAILSTLLVGSAVADIKTVRVQTYKDKHCTKENELLTIKYNSNTDCSPCQGDDGGFKSFKPLNLPKGGANPLVSYSLAWFAGAGPGSCNVGSYVNSTYLKDNIDNCITSVTNINHNEFGINHLKIEFSAA